MRGKTNIGDKAQNCYSATVEELSVLNNLLEAHSTLVGLRTQQHLITIF
jgi:predicted transcriptional regulator